jgi:hypothetical protein
MARLCAGATKDNREIGTITPQRRPLAALPTSNLWGGFMRTAVATIVVGILLAAAYALAPLWIAMDMRRAALAGDRATLEARVDWVAVRASLKASLADIERARQADAAQRSGRPPSLWSRIKAAASPSRYADQLIDRYVTPDGVLSLAANQAQFKALFARGGRSADDIDLPEHARPLTDRAQRFWARLKRVTYTSLTTLEIEVADRRVPERSYLGNFAFEQGRWRIVAVHVRGAGF